MPEVAVALRDALTGEPVQRFSFALEPGDEIVFGRGADAQIPIPDPERKVSSRHGRIACAADGSVQAYDLGSLNGTYCGGRALDQNEGHVVGDGDVLRVGDYELVLEVGAAPAEDLDATICSRDVRSLCDRLVDRLHAVWAAGVGGPQPELQTALRTELDAVTASLSRREADVLLADLADRFEVAAEAPPAAGATAPRPVPTAPAAANGTAPGSLQALAERFVPGRLETEADAEAFARLLHQFTECALDWLAKALAGRGVFAREFGAEVTLIFQRSNNPLKAMDRDQLMQYLLDWRAETDADTRKYFLEGVLRDLTEHQVGILAGFDEALDAIVQRLAPERVETAARKARGWSRSARAWRAFQQLHRELTEERAKVYNEIISPAIQRGYLQRHDEPSAGAAASD